MLKKLLILVVAASMFAGCSGLKDAVKSNNVSQVQSQIKGGVEKKDLDDAIKYAENIDVAKALVEAGADVNIGLSEIQNIDTLKYLIDKGADVRKGSPLAKSNYLDRVKFLIEKGADINNPENVMIEPTEEVIKAINIDVINSQIAILEYLIKNGLDVKQSYKINPQKWKSSDVTFLYGNNMEVKYLRQSKILSGSAVEAISFNIFKKTDPYSFGGGQPIDFTNLYNKLCYEKIKILVKNGADTKINGEYIVDSASAGTTYFKTGLILMAIRNADKDFVKLLIEKKVDVNEEFYDVPYNMLYRAKDKPLKVAKNKAALVSDADVQTKANMNEIIDMLVKAGAKE